MITSEEVRPKLQAAGWRLLGTDDAGGESWDCATDDGWEAAIALSPDGEHWCDYGSLARILEFVTITNCVPRFVVTKVEDKP